MVAKGYNLRGINLATKKEEKLQQTKKKNKGGRGRRTDRIMNNDKAEKMGGVFTVPLPRTSIKDGPNSAKRCQTDNSFLAQNNGDEKKTVTGSLPSRTSKANISRGLLFQTALLPCTPPI